MLASFLKPGLFRLLLATAVVISHVSNLEIGRPAVMIFFILSGYWVARMYDKKYAAAPNTLRIFYLSRALRIWPLYAACLILTVTVFSLSNINIHDIHASSFMLLGIASTGHDPLGVSWSLDIEMQFYLLLPLLLGLFSWADQHASGQMKLQGILFAAFLWGWYLQLEFGIWTVLSYLPAFAAGIFLARSKYLPSIHTAMRSAIAFVAIGLIAAFIPLTQVFLLKDAATPFPEDWFGMLWASTLIPFIAFSVQQKSAQLDRHLGNISYALYLIHWPVLLLTQSFLAAPLGNGWKTAALLFSAITSLLVYRLLDIPLEKLRHRLVEHQQQSHGKKVPA